MGNNNDYILQLLEMLDDPKAYSEKEILDIINHDDNTRETYRLMVEAKRSSRWKQNNLFADVNAAWQHFSQQHYPQKQPSPKWMKKAASFIGLLLVSGIALATIHFIRMQVGKDVQTPNQETIIPDPPQQTLTTDTLRNDTTITDVPATMAPAIFDNVLFDKMMTEMAEYYHKEAVFQSDEARQFRFYFVWYKEQPIEKIVETLNRFEHVNIMIEDNKLIVK